MNTLNSVNGLPFVSGFVKITYEAGKRLKELGVVPPPICDRHEGLYDSFFLPSWEAAEGFEVVVGDIRHPNLLRLKGE